MLSPEMWFTLYELARKGAIYRKYTITTRQLGDILGTSQQTASRRLSECVKLGMIQRFQSAEGTVVQITEKGKKELLDILKGLEAAFIPPREKIVITGRVTEGLGEGAYYVEIYSEKFQRALGFFPFPGTLNLRVVDDEARKAVEAMKKEPPLIVPSFTYKGRTFGDVICYKIEVNRKIKGAVVIAQRTHHSEDILEIIAPVNLREHLNLKNEDIVELTVVPLHQE